MKFYHKLITALGECCLLVIILVPTCLAGVAVGHLIIHTPLEVATGFALGVALAYLYHRLTGDDT